VRHGTKLLECFIYANTWLERAEAAGGGFRPNSTNRHASKPCPQRPRDRPQAFRGQYTTGLSTRKRDRQSDSKWRGWEGAAGGRGTRKMTIGALNMDLPPMRKTVSMEAWRPSSSSGRFNPSTMPRNGTLRTGTIKPRWPVFGLRNNFAANSMAALPNNFLEFSKLLNEHKVEYVGGYAPFMRSQQPGGTGLAEAVQRCPIFFVHCFPP